LSRWSALSFQNSRTAHSGSTRSKLDGYQAVAVNREGKLTLFSRRRKSFNRQFPQIVEGLSDLPTNTVVDGEIVALDESGRPDFNLLQNFRSGASHIHYFVFDLLIYKNRDLTHLPPIERREIMRSALPFGSTRVHISEYAETSASNMLRAIREQGYAPRD
jgi:ATP-dependent DNA ligase